MKSAHGVSSRRSSVREENKTTVSLKVKYQEPENKKKATVQGQRKIRIKWIVNDSVALNQDAKLFFFLYVWICIFTQMGLNKSVYLLAEL